MRVCLKKKSCFFVLFPIVSIISPLLMALAPPRHIVSCAVSLALCAASTASAEAAAQSREGRKEESLSLMDCHCSLCSFFYFLFSPSWSSPTAAAGIVWARMAWRGALRLTKTPTKFFFVPFFRRCGSSNRALRSGRDPHTKRRLHTAIRNWLFFLSSLLTF